MIQFIIPVSKWQWIFPMLLLTSRPIYSSTQTKIDTTYQRELDFSVNGQKAKGVYVAPKAKMYKMIFNFPAPSAVVKITTCHREETFRDVSKTLSYEYKPQPFLEDQGSCLFEIASFDLGGANTWGLIDFQGDETLYANQGCNGQTWVSNGVSICQSRLGLIQTIIFQKPTTVSNPDRCPKMTSTDKLNFYYEMALDKCVYLFSNDNQFHRLTTLGYDEVLLK